MAFPKICSSYIPGFETLKKIAYWLSFCVWRKAFNNFTKVDNFRVEMGLFGAAVLTPNIRVS